MYTVQATRLMTYRAANRLATVNSQAVKYDAEGDMLVGPLAGQMQNYTLIKKW